MTSLDELAAPIRVPHLVMDEDCWYSCAQAKHTDGSWAACDDDRAGKPCDCGADRRNAALDSLLTRAKEAEAQQPATVHRAEDGMMTLDWPDGQREVPVTRSLMEDIIQQLNQRTALERDRDTYRAALEVIAANEYDDSGDGPNYVTIARQATTTPDKPDKEKR